jgi:hypothetical protein
MDTSTWATIEEIFRDLLIFVAFMTLLLVALVVIVSMLPPDNPLKRTLTALSYRVGATAAAGALAIPIEPIPGLDAVYDIGAPILLIWYWYTFFRNLGRNKSPTPVQKISRHRT